LPGSLKRRKEVEIFRNFPAKHINICQKAKKEERVKDFQKKFLAEHVKILPGSQKRRRSGQIFV